MIMSHLYKSLKSAVGILALTSEAAAEKQVVPFNENQKVHLKVSNKSMNRLSVVGDRVQEVVGLDESITVERNDQHGHLFLRFPEEFTTTQDITLITEGGLVQDIALDPTNKPSTTIVFKREGEDEEERKASHSISDGHMQNVSHQSVPVAGMNTPFQDMVIGMMKALHQGMGQETYDDGTRECPYGLSVKMIRRYKQSNLVGDVHEIVNIKDMPINLLEKDFYKLGDMAISVGKKQLEPGDRTLLLIVRKA